MTRPASIATLIVAFCGFSTFVVGLGSKSAPKVHERKVSFNRDVLPILSEHCFRCHGPDAAAVAANLRLDSFITATADRGGYQVIAPHEPGKSQLLIRVGAEEEYMRMPPVNSGVAALSSEQIEILRVWIASGAEYRKHWAYIAPEAPALPKVKNNKWARQGLDLFVLSAMEDQGLAPEREADLVTLARRASLVLTGLPANLEDIDTLLKDKRPGAYERYVDKLLESPRYGEHQARYWLDAVRYGDTHGLHLDNERVVWPYRDWVVRAFNDDLPIDQFATWQLAGDLLPNPTTQQLIATGYVRMNLTTSEGGAIVEEVLANNTFDRVDTMSTVFLGLTVGCAKCHDHKYDPITQEEYYGLFAFFNSTTDEPLDGNALSPAPTTKASTPEQEKVLKGWADEMAALTVAVDQKQAREWILAERSSLPTVRQWEISQVYVAKDHDTAFATEYPAESPGSEAGWKSFAVNSAENTILPVGDQISAIYLRTELVAQEDSTVTLNLGSDDAIRVWHNGTVVHSNKVLRSVSPGADKVDVKLKKGVNTFLFKVTNGGGPAAFVYSLGDKKHSDLADVRTRIEAENPTPADFMALAQAYLVYGPKTDASNRFMSLTEQTQALTGSIPLTLIAQEMTTPRKARLLARGDYSLPKQEVNRMVPNALGELQKGAPLNRLGLAQWITSDENPLFARVYVNRIWQQYFGTGIVRTPENYGVQGEWPTNVDLLDHLASRFVREGWSNKQLHREIVTSATFRQRSMSSNSKRERDPNNLFLARGPRFRLDAEVVRDQALTVSDLLVTKMGGRGVNTYQPEGIWEAVAYTSSNTAKFVRGSGDDLYRRSIYLFWKRTSPPPAMAVFDAPSREACIVNRSKTNTPLQALVGMNGPQFFEASRVFAERVIGSSKDDKKRVEHAFRKATGRVPTKSETTIILRSLDRQKVRFKQDKDAAEKLVSSGEFAQNKSLDPVEHAAWTVVCNMLLNLDEVVTVN